MMNIDPYIFLNEWIKHGNVHAFERLQSKCDIAVKNTVDKRQHETTLEHKFERQVPMINDARSRTAVDLPYDEDVIKQVFNRVVDKLFSALEPDAISRDADSNKSFLRKNAFESVYRRKYEDLQQFHQQGLLLKELVHQLKKRRVDAK